MWAVMNVLIGRQAWANGELVRAFDICGELLLWIQLTGDGRVVEIGFSRLMDVQFHLWDDVNLDFVRVMIDKVKSNQVRLEDAVFYEDVEVR